MIANPLMVRRGGKKGPLGERLWRRVDVQGECWVWTGALGRGGYGCITPAPGLNASKVHRVAYELSVGPIPEGLHIDHLCRNRACVRPDHLEAVTPAENTRRGLSPTMVTSRTGICKRGHLIGPGNVRVTSLGARQCYVCYRAANALAYQRAKERRHAQS